MAVSPIWHHTTARTEADFLKPQDQTSLKCRMKYKQLSKI